MLSFQGPLLPSISASLFDDTMMLIMIIHMMMIIIIIIIFIIIIIINHHHHHHSSSFIIIYNHLTPYLVSHCPVSYPSLIVYNQDQVSDL